MTIGCYKIKIFFLNYKTHLIDFVKGKGKGKGSGFI